MIVRLRKAGQSIYYHPKVSVSRPQRPSYKDFIIQMFRYGLGRAELTRSNKRNFNFKFMMFALFFVGFFGYAIFLAFAEPIAVFLYFFSLAIAVYGLYLVTVFFESKIRLSQLDKIMVIEDNTNRSRISWWRVMPHFFLLSSMCHFFFGLGIFYGFLYRGLKADKKNIQYEIFSLKGKNNLQAKDIESAFKNKLSESSDVNSA